MLLFLLCCLVEVVVWGCCLGIAVFVLFFEVVVFRC